MTLPKPKVKTKAKPIEVSAKIDLMAGYDASRLGLGSQPIKRNSFCTCAFCSK